MLDDPQNNSNFLKDGETVEDALGEKLRIIQSKDGYKYSLDAYLLAHFTRFKKSDRTVLDLGTGSGILALLLVTRWSFIKAVGIEIQEEMADMAGRSIQMNHLPDRAEIIMGDIRKISALCKANSFDVVVSNPPYRKLQTGRINPDRQKASARHEIKGTLHDFLYAAHFALKKSGRVFLIYPASRMVNLLFEMRAAHLEPKRLQIVHSKNGMEGELVLVEGFKEGREELHILPPLYVYHDNGGYTEDINSIFENLSRTAFP